MTVYADRRLTFEFINGLTIDGNYYKSEERMRFHADSKKKEYIGDTVTAGI